MMAKISQILFIMLWILVGSLLSYVHPDPIFVFKLYELFSESIGNYLKTTFTLIFGAEIIQSLCSSDFDRFRHKYIPPFFVIRLKLILLTETLNIESKKLTLRTQMIQRISFFFEKLELRSKNHTNLINRNSIFDDELLQFWWRNKQVRLILS